MFKIDKTKGFNPVFAHSLGKANKFAFRSFISQIKTAYFIGIGGIGMAALAQIFLEYKIKVFGSDLVSSEVTKNLEKLGAEIKTGPQIAENIKQDYNILVYTGAIPRNHPELIAAQKRKIKCLSYAEALSELVNKSFGIAVTGTHGKTSTTAMLGKALIDGGIDPTVVVGSNIKEFKGNAYVGESDYFVFEACEYKNNFSYYKPKIAVVTNIEMDHPDYFKDIEHMREVYLSFLKSLKKDSLLVCCGDDKNIQKVIKKLNCKIVTYGINDKQLEYRAQNIKYNNSGISFEVIERGKNLGEFKLQVAGEHNVLNALAVVSVARHLKVDLDKIKESLKNFQGSWRRLSKRAEVNDILILDDYGHHPTAVKTTLKAAKQFYPGRRIWCVYQPHHHDRTEVLFDDFIPAFDDADVILMTEIYTVSGREDKDEKHEVSSKDLYEKIKERHKEIYYQPTLEKTEKFLVENLKLGDVCILMGAGDIYDVGEGLVERLKSGDKTN